MKIEGHTRLDSLPGVSPAARELLRSLWIESAEELLALTAAADRGLLERELGSGVNAMQGSARSLVSAPRASGLLQARAGGGLGCKLDPKVLAAFQAERRVNPRRERPPAAFAAKLPPAVRLVDRFQPVRDQGMRGTCVAFASVALREFIEGGSVDLSEQFLYWACKEMDGIAGAGTFIRTAMAALDRYGACRGATWQYNPQQDNDNEGQGPPPPAAMDEAPHFRMQHTRSVEPSLVEHYKQILAGAAAADRPPSDATDAGGAGMPVVFATLVFPSWYMSAETHRTGKITLPLPGEQPYDGGHAWCIAGYVDDPGVPGGGYFIVRNSWGAAWAPDGPEAAGHAVMPYEYVARYAVEAFSGESTTARPAPSDREPAIVCGGVDEFAPCLYKLPQEARDPELKRWPAGTIVLRDPFATDKFMMDNDTNRRRFRDRDYTWTDQSRRRVWFPDPLPELKAELQAVQSARERFVAALDENMTAARRQPVPDVNLPYRIVLLPWELKLHEISAAADLTDEVVNGLRAMSGVPADLAWPETCDQMLRDLCSVKVYRLQGTWMQMHVVAAFVTPMRFERGAGARLVGPGADVLDAVRAAYRQWKDRDGSVPRFTFYSLGSHARWDDKLHGHAAGDHWLVFSSANADARTWEVRTPPRYGDRMSLRNFLDRLKPETRGQRISRIKYLVDELLETERNVLLEDVAEKTRYRKSVVRDAFLTMQQQSPDAYRLEKRYDGRVQIRKAQPGERIGITEASFRKTLIRRHILGLLGTAAGAGGWVIKDWIRSARFDPTGFFILIPTVYVASCLQAIINRRASEDKE